VHVLAQPPLGADPEAVADDQHADQKLRIDRGPAGVAVVRTEVLAQLTEIEEAIDAAQQVVGRYVIVEMEGIKQPVLIAADDDPSSG
jgi:hypothetical protein